METDNNKTYTAESDVESKNEKIVSKKRIALLTTITVVAMLVITAVVIFLCTDFLSNESSYTTVIDKQLEAIQDIDVNKYMEILPSDYIQYTLDTTDSYKNYDDMLLDYEDMLWQENRKNKKTYGVDFKIVYEIKEDGHCKDQSELTKLSNKFNSAYNCKTEITEAVKAVVSTEVKSPEGSGDRTTETMYFLRIDGKWYLDVEELSKTLDY